MKSNDRSRHVSSFVLTLLFSTMILGAYSSDNSDVSANQVEAEEVSKQPDTGMTVPHNDQQEKTEQNQKEEQNQKNQLASNDTDEIQNNKQEVKPTQNEDNSVDAKSQQNSSKTETVQTTENQKGELAKTTNSVVENNTQNDKKVVDSVQEESSNESLQQENLQKTEDKKNIQKASAPKTYAKNNVFADFDDDGNMFFSDTKGNRYKNQFVEYQGDTYYSDADGKIKRSTWLNKEKEKYYFDDSGRMATNGINTIYDEQNDDYQYYLFNEDGRLIVKPGWNQHQSGSESYWVYVDQDFSLKNSWQKLDNNIYYFDDAKMLEGIHAIYNNETREYLTYLFNQGGDLNTTTGWHTYVEPWDNENKWVYVNADHTLAEGWQELGNKTYYFANAKMLEQGIHNIYNNETDEYPSYLFNQGGDLNTTTGWHTYVESSDNENKWVYVNADYTLAEDWQVIDQEVYYFDSNSFRIENGTYSVYENGNNQYFLFDGSGRQVQKTGWYQYTDTENDDSYWVFFDQDDSLKNGWQKLGNKTYYFENAKMLEQGIHAIYNNETGEYPSYLFNQGGDLWTTPGWHIYVDPWDGENEWVYVNADHTLAEGWQELDNKTYYFADAKMLEQGIHDIYNHDTDENASYLFNQGGDLNTTTGWHTYVELWDNENKWVYVNADYTLAEGWQVIGKGTYFLKPDHIMAENGTYDVSNDSDSQYFLFDESGLQVQKIGWYQYADKVNNGSYWVYFNRDGSLKNGWQELGNKTYYFADAKMLEQGIHDIYNHDTDENASYLFNQGGDLSTTTGWRTYIEPWNNESGWVYVNADHTLAEGWQVIGKGTYFFKPDHIMAENGTHYVFNDNDSQYFLFDESGRQVQKIGWYQYADKVDNDFYWVYFNRDGSLKNGWQELGNKTYYFADAKMLEKGIHDIYNNESGEYSSYLFNQSGDLSTTTGWHTYVEPWNNENGWVYVNADHTLAEGWQVIGKGAYFFMSDYIMAENGIYDVSNNSDSQYFLFDESGRQVQKTGWYQYADKVNNDSYWVCFNQDGSLKNGWQKFGNSIYYFEDAEMLEEGIHSIYNSDIDKSMSYLFNQSGTLYTAAGWHTYVEPWNSENGWVYVNVDHTLAEGWQVINQEAYYFDSNSFRVENGTYSVYENGNNQYFLFDESGRQVQKTGWYQYTDKVNNDSYWVCFNQDSSLKNGWQKFGNTTYYFDYGRMLDKGINYVSDNDGNEDKYYLFNDDGGLITTIGWHLQDNNWVYVNGSGSLANRWQKINGQYYYFEYARMFADGVESIVSGEGKTVNYLIDWNGHEVIKSGFIEYKGLWYFVQQDGSLAQGWKKDSHNRYYYFDLNNSSMLSDTSFQLENDKAYLVDSNGVNINSIGWHLRDGSYYYVKNSNGELANDWYQVGNNTFNFDYDGKMQANTLAYKDQTLYYLNNSGYIVTSPGIYGNDNFLVGIKSNGQVAVNEWIKNKNNWYYADINGALVIGRAEKTNNGQVYVFDENGHYFNKNGLVVVHDKYHVEQYADTYFYLKNGIVITNQWYKDNGSWYYADQNGYRARNEIITDSSGNLYAFDKNGYYSQANGWHHAANEYGEEGWYFIGSANKILNSQWLKSGNNWYYLLDDGSMATGKIQLNVDGKSKDYYFDKIGRWQNNGWLQGQTGWFYLKDGKSSDSGWKKIDGSWYYFDNEGEMLSSTFIIQNKYLYVFDQNGKYSLGKNGWYQNNDQSWYYFDNNDFVKSVWKKINGYWYYFDEYGHMYQGTETYLKNKKYLFDVNGHMVETKGLVEIDKGYYVFISGNHYVKNAWIQINGSWYYFDEYDTALVDGVYNIGGTDYYFNEKAKNIKKSGWVLVSDKRDYYYIENDSPLKSKWKKINNKWYYFDKTGLMVQGTKLINGTYYQFNSNGACINA